MHGQDKTTFCNPLDLVVPGERSYRGGEPVVLIYQDDYFLFVSHRKGYWYSPDFKNWTYVDAPNYPGGVVSVVEMDGSLYGCSTAMPTCSTMTATSTSTTAGPS